MESGVWDSFKGPPCLAAYLQGSAICGLSPCCITSCLWLQVEVGIFWPSVQLTSFRRRVKSSGCKLMTEDHFIYSTGPLRRQRTLWSGRHLSSIFLGWSSDLFSPQMTAFQVDHTHGKNTWKREGLFIWKLPNSDCISCSGLPCWVTPNSRGHQLGKMKYFPVLGFFNKKGCFGYLED